MHSSAKEVETMLVVKHQEPEMVDKKKEKEFESIGQILADEIFTSMEGYAIKGVENEVTPNKKKPKPYDIVDI